MGINSVAIRTIAFLLTGLGARACAGQDLKVMTWNIRFDNPADSADRWDLRKEALARFVLEQKPVIVGLQEGLSHQLAFLDKKWPRYKRFGVGREDGVAAGEFCPIYYDTTRFRLLEGHTYWLAPNPAIPGKGWDAANERIATFATLIDKRSRDTIAVMNTHWDHEGAMARMNSAALIRRVLNPLTHAGMPAILMGDLNAVPGSTEIGLLQSWLVDACPADRPMEPTFNGFRIDEEPVKRIDYLWYSPGDWSTRIYGIQHPMVNGRHVSDHFPVLVELERDDRR